jgi:hypothetical protein
MKLRLLLGLLVVVWFPALSFAQQPQMQPLTFWYGYHVNPGKESEFPDLIKTVGQPVRDKLMEEGVVLAWGMDVPPLRVPGESTHLIWYAVSNYAGVEKVADAMKAQIAKLDEEAAKGGAAKKGAKAAGVSDRLREIVDVQKTHDFLTRDLIIGISPSVPGNVLPWTRFAFVKVKPGKGAEFRKAWEKYNKPIYDKLLADGVILGYGLSIEEVRTSGEFTHFAWVDTKNLADMDKLRVAFNADRDRRSQEEQDAMTSLFASLLDLDASRQELSQSIIFHVRAPK